MRSIEPIMPRISFSIVVGENIQVICDLDEGPIVESGLKKFGLRIEEIFIELRSTNELFLVWLISK